MLAQAVHSEDQKLMEEVLRVSKEKVVMATVRRLPVTCVIPFLKHVSLLLHFRTKSIQLQNLENCLFLNILLYLTNSDIPPFLPFSFCFAWDT